MPAPDPAVRCPQSYAAYSEQKALNRHMKLAYSGVSETSHSVEDNDSRDKAKADILGASRRSLGSDLPKCVRVLRSTAPPQVCKGTEEYSA